MQPAQTLSTPWPTGQKWAFRFAILFFILFIFFNPNGAVPFLEIFYNYYIQPMHGLVVWAGTHIFHLPEPITTFTNGSGDTTYDYLVLLFCVTVALVGATVWSAVNRQACNYDKLYYWLNVILRFYLGITMVSYGAVKVIKLQFPTPGPARLLQTYGSSSPMGLAWTFMGYSKGYNYFTGFAELSCGLLLLFRKTALLGAVIALVVSANIMAINYCFDVPVKILSTMMVVICLYLLSKDFARFINFFFLNRVAQPANLSPKRFTKRWMNITLISLKYLLIAYVTASTVENCIQGFKLYGDDAPKPPLSGLYNVETFVTDGDTLAPVLTEAIRWRRLNISAFGNAQIYLMNDSVETYKLLTDTTVKSLGFYEQDQNQRQVLYYTAVKPGLLLLKGKLYNNNIEVTMRKIESKDFLLMNRGFHWINEYPFNR
ncbi:DoxX family protein [Mucilaginibacter sp. PAMB04274]|uniref:DoxX family protein n=1 Tax=Mucilaginibacter sp. PAMB04274 TaxID=3138568 RepID=UPI0031F64E43